MNIKKEIFKKYDIRGLNDEEITNELAYNLGLAFGFISDGYVIVGHDARLSSNSLNTNLIKGLLDVGVNVIDIGLVTTPMLYYARKLLNKDYAIMITASHLGKDYNGFKLCDNEGDMYGDKITNLLDIIQKNNFIKKKGALNTYDITYDYKKLMFSKIKLGTRKLKIVVDCGNGTTSYYNPEILKDFGMDIIPLYCESIPSYPNHDADPAVEANMRDLQKKVIEEKADLGIAYDGDGDRIGIVDENGRLLTSDEIIIFIWKYICKTNKNKTSLIDVASSYVLKEFLEKKGLNIKYTKLGHSYIKNQIKENNYDFVGECSGHMYFNDDFYGYDDALYVTLRILEFLTNNTNNISYYLEDILKYYSYHDYIEVNDKGLIIKKVKKYAHEKNYKIINIDGIRIEYDNGYALVRKSNTSSKIFVKFEGKTKDDLQKYKDEIFNVINEYIKI